jgi:hypothetical protein
MLPFFAACKVAFPKKKPPCTLQQALESETLANGQGFTGCGKNLAGRQ